MFQTPEGRAAIEGYKAKLVNALKTDVPAEIDRLAQEYGSKIDQFLKEVEAAKNHDELNAAIDKAEGTLTEEHAKKFMQEEQQKIVSEKLETALEEVKAEAAKAREVKPAGTANQAVEPRSCGTGSLLQQKSRLSLRRNCPATGSRTGKKALGGADRKRAKPGGRTGR
jgi:hypothetical protein